MPHRVNQSAAGARAASLALALAAAALGAGAAGCRGDRTDAPPRQFLPDMDDQPRWDPQEATDLFPDGRTQRLPPDGAVAYGRASFNALAHADEPWAASFMLQRAQLLQESDEIYRGTRGGAPGSAGDDLAAVEWVDAIPVAVTPELIERGRERFNIYCAVCHGYGGDGRGTVGLRWSYAPANITGAPYTDRSQMQGKDGYLFHVVLNGVGEGDNRTKRMPGYRHALDQMDAWAVVAYVRALQAASNASIEDVADPAVRQRLEQARSLPQAAPAPAAGEAATPDQPAGDAQPPEPGQDAPDGQNQPADQPAAGENGGAS